VLYVLLWLLPIAAAALLVLRRRGPAIATGDAPHVASLIAMCALLDLFIMRPPVAARLGGMAGPVVVLVAWIARQIFVWARPRRRVATVALRALQVGFVLVVVAAVWNLGVVAEWHRLRANPPGIERLRANLAAFSQSPPDAGVVSPRLAGMVAYVRACTLPHDRVYASWFVPELYFLAQRGFGGGIVATFSNHWSERRFQERSVAALASESVPIVLIQLKGYDQFVAAYPLMIAYLRQHYRVAGETTFGDAVGGPYRVLVRRDRTVTRIEPTWSLPCLA
jgi:hypothetical protein